MSESRVPPGQHLTYDFPVLHYGNVPRIELASWRLRIYGLVREPLELTWEQFLRLPQVEVRSDFHCVTMWSKLDNVWEGVLFRNIASLVSPRPEALYVVAHGYGGFTTNLPLSVLMDDDVLLARRHNGADLTPDHGWPLRLVVPKRYAWKSAKWLNGLEFLDHDEPGFWEQHGYHNNGDPWREERYST